MAIPSRLNNKVFREEEFDNDHYIQSLHRLIDMQVDRKLLYPHDRYIQLAIDAFISDLRKEIHEVQANQPNFLPVFFSPEEISKMKDIEFRTEWNKYKAS